MLKLLRRYNKFILVIGGAILMVAFTLPQLPQLFGASRFSQQMAVIDGEIIRGRQYDNYRRQFAALQQIAGPQALGIEDLEHYMLLAYEANKYGFVGGPDDAQTVAPLIAPIFANLDARFRAQRGDFQTFMRLQQEPEAVIAEYEAAIRANRQRALQGMPASGPAGVDTALANLRGILRLRQAYSSLPLFSKPEAIDLALEVYDKAVADIAVVTIGDTAARAETLSESELAEFFEQYKDQRPGDNEYGVGYLRPQAARVEYLVIDRGAVRERIEADAIDVRTFYDGLPEERRAALGPFSENRDRIEQAFLDARADDTLARLRSAAQSAMIAPRRDLQRDRRNANYFELSETWAEDRPSLETVRERLLTEAPEPPAGVTDPQPIVTLHGDDGAFASAQELADRQRFPGLAAARLTLNETTSLRPGRLLTISRELVGRTDDPVVLQESQLVPVQEGLFLTRPLETPGGDLVFVRFTEIRPASPPPSWTDVEEQLRQDLAEVQAYEELLAEGQLYADALAAAESLDEFEQASPAVEQTISDAVVTREAVLRELAGQPFAPANVEAFRDAVMDLVEDWSPTADVQEMPASQRSLAVGAPSRRSLIVAKVTGRWPMTREEFQSDPIRIAQLAIAASNALTETANPFAKEVIADRLNYEDLQRDDADGA